MRICSLNPRRDEFSLRGGRFGRRVDRRSGRRRCLCKSSEPLFESKNFWTFGRHFDASDLEVLLRYRWWSTAGNRVRGSRLWLAYPQSLQFPFLYVANTSRRLDALSRLPRLLLPYVFPASALQCLPNVSPEQILQAPRISLLGQVLTRKRTLIQDWMLLKEVDLR